MTTYTEQQGHEPFDWWYFLNDESATKTEFHNAYRLSMRWVTCACGNLCDTIPRRAYTDGEPVDQKLRSSGVNFMLELEGCCNTYLNTDASEFKRHRNNAKAYLKIIDTRSAELLKELNENIR